MAGNELEQHPESSQPRAPKQECKSLKRPWTRAVIFCSLVLCLLILIVRWRQSPATYSLRFPSRLLPERAPHHEDHIKADSPPVKDPDALRPKIELHPEDHVYRDAVTQHLDWTVTADDRRPDGVLKRVYLINDLFPGPTVEARSSDVLMINITNALHDEPLSIHWHGLHTDNSMDGVASVTQNAIPPGSSFTYRISIPSDQCGTFWYHAHGGLARADGLYGGFVVHDPVPKSSVRGLMVEANSALKHRDRMNTMKDVLLLIGDWYHRPAAEVMAWYMRAASFGNEPVPDSLLINGLGSFNCSMAVPARPVDCTDHPIDLSHVLPTDAAYRVRVVNTGSLAGFTLTFDNHDITVLEVDSIAVQTQDKDSSRAVHSAGILYPGQRMDLLVRSASDKPSTLKIDLDKESFKYPNPALAPTQTFSPFPPKNQTLTQHDLDAEFTTHSIDIHHLPSAGHILSLLPKSPTVTSTEVVYTKIQKLSIRHNIPYGFFNRTSWEPQTDPAIPLNELDRAQWDKNQFGITINKPPPPSTTPVQGTETETETNPNDVWVDLVVNNLDEGGHPFHFHGHHFYVLTVHQAAIGWGSYNPFVDRSPPGLDPSAFPETNGYDMSNAMLRDTVYIPSRGYAVLRFRADKPGPWLFHCHILWHLANGMAMVVDVREDT